MLKHPEITLGRLRRFAQELKPLIYPASTALSRMAVFSAPGRISFDEAMKGKYRPAREGERFGPEWSTHWFRIEYTVPKAWSGREVLLHFDSTSESCVWQKGVPIQGLTNYNWGPQDIRSYFTLTSRAKGGERGTLFVETAINGLFGLTDISADARRNEIGHLRHARLVVRDRAAWNLYCDFIILKELAEHLPASGPFQGGALAAANEVANVVTLDQPETFAAGSAVARRFLAERKGGRNHHVSAIGHAHIDTAWLWPLAESKRKCYRTFSSAVRLMDDYPEYKFACSQAQQLAWIKEAHPRLFAQLKAKAAQGQFVPVGGTWIEPDCNLPSGESLVRQFLFGQRFFRKEFGAYCSELWNPDVFGYSGALPQIMRGAGIRYFLTQKLSWNQFNRPTSSTLLWEGIDGSRVLTHFPPADTYNGIASVEEIHKHYTHFKDKDRANESLYLFGWGDGGGGPTEEMLERLRRLKDVPGLPEVVIRSPREFFERCEADITEPMVWSGELYFELHRGTYTTQAATKRDNRRCEEALHDAEFLSAMAHQLTGTRYPKADLDRLWEIVLLNQFHDIIPGSSINEVYRDSDAQYTEVLTRTGEMRSRMLQKIIPAEKGPASNLLALNTLGFPRAREIVSMPGKRQPVFVAAPSYGYSIVVPHWKPEQPVLVRSNTRGFTFENGIVTARFDRSARLVSFFDHRCQREAIAAGQGGNQFVLYEDLPERWDAWDVDVYHLEKRQSVGKVHSIRIVESDPLRATVEIRSGLSSRASLVQRISLSADSPRLDFDNRVDWQEKNRFLKVEFPLALRSDHATYEIQFGHLRRPTHFNTTWDMARFESSAHRWADLSEPNFGVALLNDCKYGYACHGNVLRLSLLRAAKSPDETADMGEHNFRYALFPHANGPQQAGVVAEAAIFNQPLQIQASSAPVQSRSFFALDNPAVVLDTVKQAEDSEALILRFYESQGAQQSATLTTFFPLEKVVRVNLLEEDERPMRSGPNTIPIRLAPFELLTLKLTLAAL